MSRQIRVAARFLGALLLVGLALREQLQHFTLARRQKHGARPPVEFAQLAWPSGAADSF